MSTGQNALDRATAGFPYVVASQMWDPTPQDLHHLSSTRYLSEHAKKLYAELAAGKTIQQAVASANASFRPAGKTTNGIDSMNMTSRGDPYMRLIKANLLAISGKAYRPGPTLTVLLRRRVKG